MQISKTDANDANYIHEYGHSFQVTTACELSTNFFLWLLSLLKKALIIIIIIIDVIMHFTVFFSFEIKEKKEFPFIIRKLLVIFMKRILMKSFNKIIVRTDIIYCITFGLSSSSSSSRIIIIIIITS